MTSLSIHVLMDTNAPSSFAIVDITANKYLGTEYHCICMLVVNPQQCNCWDVSWIYFSLTKEVFDRNHFVSEAFVGPSTLFSRVTVPSFIAIISVREFILHPYHH